MPKNFTILPVMTVIVIVFLTLIVIVSERSNKADIVGDSAYPHYVCTFAGYCEGNVCTRDDMSFVVYMSHANGEPRLEIPRVNPRVTLTETPSSLIFETTGGEISGTLTMFTDRALDFMGISVDDAGNTIEHFASGRCDRRKDP